MKKVVVNVNKVEPETNQTEPDIMPKESEPSLIPKVTYSTNLPSKEIVIEQIPSEMEVKDTERDAGNLLEGAVSQDNEAGFMPVKIGALKITTSKSLGVLDAQQFFDILSDSEIDDEDLRDVAAFSSDDELDKVAPIKIQSSFGKKTVSLNKSYALVKGTSVVNGIEQ